MFTHLESEVIASSVTKAMPFIPAYIGPV